MDNKLINRLELQFVVDIYPPWLTDDKWNFNFKTPDEYNNTFYIENLSKTKILRAGFDDGPVKSIQVTLEDFDKDTAYDSSSTSAVYAGQIKELSSDTKNKVSNCSNKACTNSDPVSERQSKKPKDLYLRKFRECIKLGKKCRWF